jgi:light-regulated signal transduction histidine kinase (bacteriophytochrome)
LGIKLLIVVWATGGLRKILGIVYPEVSVIPKRSRQLFWRAAVEMSRNASQLALQVPL